MTGIGKKDIHASIGSRHLQKIHHSQTAGRRLGQRPAEQRSITDGLIIPAGKEFIRKPPRRADYLLRYERNFPRGYNRYKRTERPADIGTSGKVRIKDWRIAEDKSVGCFRQNHYPEKSEIW